jgi:trimeric autotransporter adhesin
VRACVFAAVFLVAAGCVPSSAGSFALPRQRSFGVVLDAKSGRVLRTFRVNKPIRAAVADGSGGWFVGGSFIYVNGVLRKRLAHVDRNGHLDPHWTPEANGNGVSVTSLARIGSRLYVGGDFERLEGKTRFWVGAVDTTIGKLLRWQPPRASINYPVLLARHGRVYIGGYAVRGSSGVVAVRPTDGTVERGWRGTVDTSNLEGGSVRILAARGERLYLAGIFEKVDGVATPGIAAVEAGSGRLLRKWRPPLRSRLCTPCTQVGALAPGRERIYAGLPTGVVALDPVTGAIDRGWRARLGGLRGAAEVTALVRAGRRLYLTGSFIGIDGRRRGSFGAIDVKTGHVVRSWTPRGANAYGTVLATSGSRILLGIQLTS